LETIRKTADIIQLEQLVSRKKFETEISKYESQAILESSVRKAFSVYYFEYGNRKNVAQPTEDQNQPKLYLRFSSDLTENTARLHNKPDAA
jgi:hypothetical protein